MPRLGQPLSEDHKAKLKAGTAAAKARREAGELPPVRRNRISRPRETRAEPPSTKGGTPIATVDGAARDALALVLEELRAIRVLLDTRLPGWTIAPAMSVGQVKAADEIAEKVRFPVGTPVTRVWKEPAASVEARLDIAIAPQQTTAIAQPRRDNRAVVCPTCRDDGRILHVYARGPTDSPGNAWIACPDCGKGREFAAAQAAERVPMSTAAIYNESSDDHYTRPARLKVEGEPVSSGIQRQFDADPEPDDDPSDDPMADLAAELEEYAALDELPPPPPDEESIWRPRVEMFRNFGMWMEQDWGAPPGKRGCGAPDWLLDEVGIAKVAG